MTHELHLSLTSMEAFRMLLRNYGYWSHYSGCKGFFTGGDFPTPAISDETALQIDRAVMKLSQKNRNLYRLFTLFYTKNNDEQMILSILRGRAQYQKKYPHRKDYFEFNPGTDTSLKYIDISTLRVLLNRAEAFLYETLRQEEENETVHVQADYLQVAG